MRPAFELAQVIDRFGKEFELQYSPNTYVSRTLSALQRCRTASLGGHIDRCDECGHIRISYNSCRNRHCPKCQNTQREAWIENRLQDLLPVPYFHVVFTIPDCLNRPAIHKPALFYSLLFSSVWDTMTQFFLTKYHADGGMIAVLHTWGQNLSLHPHIHCIVPGGCINYKGNWVLVKISESGKAFLFPIEQLSRVFRGKLMERLEKLCPPDKQTRKEAYRKDWVVYAKEPFASSASVVEYLGRYTHKVAISNHRILDINEHSVRFKYRDYRDNQQKQMELSGTEFIRRFSQHILPRAFVRIRYFGFLSSTKKSAFHELQLIFGITPSVKVKKDWKTICREHLDYDPDLCPHCKKGKMATIHSFLPGRSPPVLDSTSKPTNQINTHQ